MAEQSDNHRPTWHDAARKGFRRVLKLYDMDDSRIVQRPAQEQAFSNLESQAHVNPANLPLDDLLSGWELRILRLEIYYMANFERREFRGRYGDGWTAGGKYGWIAGETGLVAYQVCCLLDEMSAVISAAQLDAAAQVILKEWLADKCP